MPSQLAIVPGTNPNATLKYGGECFQVPPRIQILDNGGNLVRSDNSSGVRVSIHDNPTNSFIGPEENLFVVAKQGVVQFVNIYVGLVGKNYTLRFDLYSYSDLTNKFYDMSISLISERFHVQLGPPRHMYIAQRADDGWAGNQAFYTQPTLHMIDNGGNLVYSDVVSHAEIRIVESLSVRKRIVIDTSDAPQTYFTEVAINLQNGSYGAGSVLELTLISKYHMWLMYPVNTTTNLTLFSSADFIPYLQLNIRNGDGVPVKAEMIQPWEQTRRFTFQYIIQDGDSLSTNDDGVVRLIEKDSLFLNETYIVDGNNNEVNTTLPIHTLIDTIAIVNTSIPQIIHISCNVSDGEYGGGEVIGITVTFDQEVMVHGHPYLPLLLSNDSITTIAYANFSYIVDDDHRQVVFAYFVEPGHSTNGSRLEIADNMIRFDYYANQTDINVASSYNATTNVTTRSYSYSYSYVLYDNWIRRKADYPTTNVNYTIVSSLLDDFKDNYNVVIDTSPPVVNATAGIVTYPSTGTFYPGDIITLQVKFDKPIVINGEGIRLKLQVLNLSDWRGVPKMPKYGVLPQGLAYVDQLLSDNQTIQFKYHVEAMTNITNLDIIEGFHAIILGGETGYIRRKATFPIVDANISTYDVYYSAHNSLRHTSSINLYGLKPTITDIAVYSTNPPNSDTLYPDDLMFISVKFSHPVVATCPPVFVMTNNYRREAIYYSGNQTDEFIFQYTVLIGDSSNNTVSYQSTSNVVCASSGCFRRSTCAILANSSHPTLEVDLSVPQGPKVGMSAIGGRKKGLVSFGNYSLSPIIDTRNTTIAKVTYDSPPGEYGVGSVLRFIVEFTDIVVVPIGDYFSDGSTELPRLWLNINRFAKYTSGTFTNTLIFTYVTNANDTMLDDYLAPTNIGNSSMATAISCSDSWSDIILCGIMNQGGQYVDTNITYANITTSGIILDPTPPNITMVQIASQLEGVNFTSGQFIHFLVHVSKPVVVGGVLPRIPVIFGKSEQYAIYNEAFSTDVRLIFSFQFTFDDNTLSSNITYAPASSIDMNSGYSIILRKSTIPTTPLDTHLPSPKLLTIGSQLDLNVDTFGVPEVTKVVMISPPGSYAAGDLIYLKVEFSMWVTALGKSYVLIPVAHRIAKAQLCGYINADDGWSPTGGNWTVVDDYNKATNMTKALIYRYEVEPDDLSVRVQYADTASLIIGLTDNNDVGYIKRYNDYVLGIDAELTLPMLSSDNSLGPTSDGVMVDGRQPYLISIQIVNEDTMIYTTNHSIEIAMTFSSTVFVLDGYPYLLLETGLIDHEAFYMGGNGTKTLTFVYDPEPGDVTDALDYIHDRQRLNSASEAFQYNGCRIVAASENPYLPVKLWLNPPRGNFGGVTVVRSAGGVFEFRDAFLSHYGLDYKLQYIVTPYNLNTTFYAEHDMFVSFSAERQLRPETALHGERIGHSVDIEDDILVIGAPNFNVSVTTVQVVKVTHEDGPPRREVQVVKTTIDPQPAIIRFHSSAGLDVTVGGYFKITVGTKGTSGSIPVNANALTLQAIFTHDLPTVGNVTVSVESYKFCACYNAFQWTLTFNGYTEGDFVDVSIDSSQVTGFEAEVSQPEVIQYPSKLTGTFTLSALGKTTDPIHYDTLYDEIPAIIENSLGLPVYEVSVTPTAVTNTKEWSITFDAYQDFYDVPTLVPDFSGLSGGKNPSVSVTVTQNGRHSPYGIAGFFQLEWRGNTTEMLRPNATAAHVKAALEALPIITYVNVNRTLLSDIGAYAWTIELVDVSYHNARGYYREEPKNLEPIVPKNHLIASEVAIQVETKWALGDRNQIFSNAREGSYGWGAGAAFVYQRQNSTWIEVATIRGNDTTEGNRFGESIAYGDDTIVVGAVGASIQGVPEIQTMHCSATSGSFQLAFRGWTTDEISFNVTHEAFVNAVIGQSRIFKNLYPITAALVSEWEGGLCENNSVSITFYSPLTGEDGSPNLELITLINLNLTNGNDNATFTIQEEQLGTWRINGPNADPLQIGAVYIFRWVDTCSPFNRFFCYKSTWQQEAQLFPLFTRQSSRYGSVVAYSGEVILVGAPGTYDESGMVYIYQYDSSAGTWPLLQTIRDPSLTSGSKFGTSVAKDGNTVVIGSPNAFDGKGAIYVFTRRISNSVFIGAQVFSPYFVSLTPDSRFGSSVAIHENTMVIGAIGYAHNSVYLGNDSAVTSRTESGAVFVYNRPSTNLDFKLNEILRPSNVKEYDHFGYKVELEDNALIVSSMQSFASDLTPSKAIIEIQTVADYNKEPLGGYFRLQWKSSNSTASARSEGVRTRLVPFDISAESLKSVIEKDLQSGLVHVNRTAVDVYNQGYIWHVTFMRYRDEMDLFTGDSRQLTGTNAAIKFRFINPTPTKIRSKVHLFQRDSYTSFFNEEVFLSPMVHQRNDQCGFSLGLSGTNAVIGCPNRDQDIPGQNSGTGFVYDLSILSVKYADISDFEVTEGKDANIVIVHDTENQMYRGVDASFYVQTVDRNANASVQNFFADLYDVMSDANLLQPFAKHIQQAPLTVLDMTELVGKSMARSQFYGTYDIRTSRWVDGRYDYYAISDYAQTVQAHSLLSEWNETVFKVPTNDDSITELPQERVVVAIQSPGIWPTVQGKLYHRFMLKDVANGHIEDVVTSDKVAVPSNVLQPDDQSGTAVAICEELSIAFLGAPLVNVDNIADAGRVYMYNLDTNGTWMKNKQVFTSPSLNAAPGKKFGSSVVIEGSKKRGLAILAIGEPDASEVHTYLSYGEEDFANMEFVYHSTLSIPEAYLQQHRFGDVGTLAIDGDLLLVGIPGLEMAVVYRLYYNWDNAMYEWSNAQYLKSSDYDYDVINNEVYLHRQEFGYSVAVSERTIVIGSPFAGYDKQASYLPENYDTEGLSIKTIGRGKAYVFYAEPAILSLCVTGSQILTTGQFKIHYIHNGINATTKILNFNATGPDVEEALNELPNMNTIAVNHTTGYRDTLNGFHYCWEITFFTEWFTIGNLWASWHNASHHHNITDITWRDCWNCSTFNFPAANDSNPIEIHVIRPIGPILEYQTLQAFDSRSGDQFGHAVAIDGNQIVVGAPTAHAMTTTTWDFEVGSLQGWTKTGNAFDYQPTFGDNPKYRARGGVDQSTSTLSQSTRLSDAFANAKQYRSSSSGLKGVYYVSTYEKHPGHVEDVSLADPKYPIGSVQGTEPKGTLSSDIFMIRGETIKFLIGGGCDINHLYVELLIDGKSISRVTGQCSETMHEVKFDVSTVRDRAAQIRIVDNSSSTNWGYISVDHFTFDWSVAGPQQVTSKKITVVGGELETPFAGSAYVFRRFDNSTEFSTVEESTLTTTTTITGSIPALHIDVIPPNKNNKGKYGRPCTHSSSSCYWVREKKLLPSDKRSNMRFGTAVAVNDATGVVLVGAPNADMMGSNRDTITHYPYYYTINGTSTAAGLNFPVAPHHIRLFHANPSFTPLSSAGYGIWQLMNDQSVNPTLDFVGKCGAVYAYNRLSEESGDNGELWRPLNRFVTEQSKIQPNDCMMGDHFGKSLSLDRSSLLVGSPEHSNPIIRGGSSYFYRTDFAAVNFSQVSIFTLYLTVMVFTLPLFSFTSLSILYWKVFKMLLRLLW